mmetsp:Transcript_50294/g.83737  ORF Transcript_50294/g.83737 Transcript_50294/m.83737 type:complete len:489 (-) Transcript_50294:157-1623(-)
MSCSLWTDYAVAVQLCLGLSIVLVLVVEYAIEQCRKTSPRTFVQFWFDSFKLCSGALVTHGYNVLCATILNYGNSDVDECAVYMIAFYYEATGITLVQMLTYGVTKFSRRRYLQIYDSNGGKRSMCSNIFYWISYPGHYTFRDSPLESAQTLLSDTDSPAPHDDHAALQNNGYGSVNADQKQSAPPVHNAQIRAAEPDNDEPSLSGLNAEAILQERLGDVRTNGQGTMLGNVTFLQTRLASTRNRILVVVFSVLGSVAVGVASKYVLEYDSIWINVMMSLFALMMFATLCVATAPVIWQTVAWILIKVVERSLWTLFVYSQKNAFIEYSQLIAFNDDVLEAVLYIAVIPLVIGTMMFWMFSNIARMNIPFIDLKKFASDVMARFDLREALKVGVYSTLLYNTILWLPAELVILSWESAAMLFLMMVLVPAVVNAIAVLILFLLLNDMDDRRQSVLSRHVENGDNQSDAPYSKLMDEPPQSQLQTQQQQ